MSAPVARPSPSSRAGRAPLAAAAILLAPGLAFAHERFVRHDLKVPLKDEFFRRYPGAFLGVHPSMLRVGLNAFSVLAAFLVVWFVRQPLDEAVARVAQLAGGRVQRAVHQVACFVTDRPVRNRVFHALGEWAVIAFLRVPGLVLMYSAANNALVLPSYPLDPRTEFFFKMAQAVLAVLILTQTLLPLCGALLVGTWLYLNRWGWIVAMDALPILSVAAVYLSSPWESHKLAITEISEKQIRAVRFTLGISFVILGWLKVYNHDLIAGVADNFPSIRADPMVSLFATGTDPRYARECWVVSFAMAEVMSGFLLMTGTFTRLWGTIMGVILTKLMLVDFGWNEVPHLCFIAAMAVIALSNRLKGELDPIEAVEERAGRDGKSLKQAAIIGGTSLGLALAVIFPTLIALTFSDRANLRL
jgi:uncharacterized membrane protein YphA (DoxX/SURF4 family)